MTILVGGVAQLYQQDLDVGRRVADVLAREGLGPDVVVEDLSYGAVAVAQRLEDVRPSALVLVGAAERGRAPGTVERRRVGRVDAPPEELQRAVSEAVTGYVSVDLVIQVAAALGALPERTVAIEVEPAAIGPGDRLSEPVAAAVDELVRLVRDEIRAAGVENGPRGYGDDMEESIRQDEDADVEPAGDTGTLRRTTEQGDELTEEHSIAMREHREYAPYTRPRQPSQDPPAR